MARANLAVIWRGTSLLDGRTPVAVVLSGLARRSENRATGDMVQAWIVPADESPHVAATTGLDVGICGSCPRRPRASSRVRSALGIRRSCYVTTFKAPRAVWESSRGLPETPIGALVHRGVPLRIGAHGDPAAVPSGVWRALIARFPAHIGYTHQWLRPCARGLRGLVMASCETRWQERLARSQGWGVFRAGTDGPGWGEEICSKARVRAPTTCSECLACSGVGASIYHPEH